jgi:hypothetical protein
MLLTSPQYGLASLARTALAIVQACRAAAPTCRLPRAHAAPAAPAGGPARPWRTTTVASLGDAEDLLDSLEACGFEERELRIPGNAHFEVRWR